MEDADQSFQEKDGTEFGSPTWSVGTLSGVTLSNMLRGKQEKGLSSLSVV